MVNWTEEQKLILSTETPFLLILAFAGTGKTSVLIEYANIRENKRFLYTAFNKQTIKESELKFSKNVTSKTLHKIAYEELGFYYKHKIKKNIDPNQIIKILRLDKNKSSYGVALKIKDIIEGYSYSGIKNISNYLDTLNFDQKTINIYKKFSETVWLSLVNTQNEYNITLDVMFKIYCNSNPVLDYDYIMLDEAQDSNGVSKKLLLSQLKNGKKLIFVGDNYQSIYKFRKSQNILINIISTKTCYLTKSFRFGKNIANEANKILSIFNETKKIKGNIKIKDKINEVDFEKKYTIINRTNSGVFGNALRLLNSGKKIFFIGGFNSYNFNRIRDIENLFNKNYKAIIDKNILSFFSFEDFLEKSIENNEKEDFLYAKLIIKFNGSLMESIEKIKKIETLDYKNADVILTNAHKSKGLEFDQVIVGSDFINLTKINSELKNCDKIKEEINLVYVAVTRARKNLLIKNTIGVK